VTCGLVEVEIVADVKDPLANDRSVLKKQVFVNMKRQTVEIADINACEEISCTQRTRA
jgi:hypothetical protein